MLDKGYLFSVNLMEAVEEISNTIFQSYTGHKTPRPSLGLTIIGRRIKAKDYQFQLLL